MTAIAEENMVLILSDYGKLSFLKVNLEEEEFEITKEFTLDTLSGYDYNELGYSIEIDPLNRAFSVAAFQQRFRIFLFGDSPSISIKESVLFQDSKLSRDIIWFQTFLYPSIFDPHKILLALFHVSSDSNTFRITIYEFSDTLKNTKQIGPLVLPSDFPRPLHMINLKHLPETLLLVTERSVYLVTYQDVAKMSTSLNEFVIPLCSSRSKKALAFSSSSLIGALAVDPVISDDNNNNNNSNSDNSQVIFGFTSDGFILAMSVSPFSVDLSFRGPCIESPNSALFISPNTVVVFSHTGDGAAYHLERSTSRFSPLFAVSCVCPLLDFCSVDVHSDGNDSIFAACGSVKGSVREVCNGIGVSVITTSSSNDFRGVEEMFSINDDLIISLMGTTYHFVYKDDELSEISDSPLATQHTLHVGHYNCFLFQIISYGLLIYSRNDFGNYFLNSEWKVFEHNFNFITLSTSFQNLIVLCSKGEAIVLKYEVSNNSLSQVFLNSSTSDISACLLWQYEGENLIALGYFSGEINVYRLNDGSSVFMEKEKYIAQSFTALEGEGKFFFLVLTKDGHVFSYQCLFEGKHSFNVRKYFSRNIGNVGISFVKFMDNGVFSKSEVLALSSKTWRIFVSKNILKFQFFWYENISKATSFKIQDIKNTFAVISNDYLRIVSLDQSVKYSRTFHLDVSPKRIDFVQGVLVVSGIEIHNSDYCSNVIQLITPTKGDLLVSETLLDNETLRCLIPWNNLIICGTHLTTMGRTLGRLLVFEINKNLDSLKNDSYNEVIVENYSINWKHRQDMEDRVNCLAPLNEQLVAFGLGKDVLVYEYEKNQFIFKACISLRSQVTCIDCQFSKIIVGTERDGLCLLNYNQTQESLEYLKSDKYPHSNTSCKIINDYCVAADKLGNIYGVSLSGQFSYLEQQFCFYLGETVVKIDLGNICMADKESDRKDRQKNYYIILATITGNIYNFKYIGKNEELARLENFLKTNANTMPLFGNSHVDFRSSVYKSFNVIDGELIAGFLNLKVNKQEEISKLLGRNLDEIIDIISQVQ